MATGTVKWYNDKKRFGFIVPDSSGPDIFVHVSALEKAGIDSLPEGQKVQYDVDENKGKPCAINLRLI